MIDLLEELGFEVSRHSTPTHKVFFHPNIPNLEGNFDCTHKSSGDVKPCYKSRIRSIINDHSENLKDVMEKKGN